MSQAFAIFAEPLRLHGHGMSTSRLGMQASTRAERARVASESGKGQAYFPALPFVETEELDGKEAEACEASGRLCVASFASAGLWCTVHLTLVKSEGHPSFQGSTSVRRILPFTW